MESNQIVYTLTCPNCRQVLPQGIKKKEIIDTLEVSCPQESCRWKALAKNFEVKKTTLEEWMGSSYRNGGDEMSYEEFQAEYEKELKSGKVPLDDLLKNK